LNGKSEESGDSGQVGGAGSGELPSAEKRWIVVWATEKA